MATTPMRAAKTHARKPTEHSSPLVPDLASHPQVRTILGDSFMDVFERTMQAVKWGEEEIAAAMCKHPEHADRIWHSFELLTLTHDLLSTEFIYRSHARELLTRVAAGQDTRLGTAAECCIACSEISLVAPLHATACGLYARMWRIAGFPQLDTDTEHHEALRARQIDELEGEFRKRLRQDSRRLPRQIEHCRGCPDWQEPEEQMTLALGPDTPEDGGERCA